MNNYHYIIASLPVLDPGYKFVDKTPESILDEITAQLSNKDRAVVDFLMRGFDTDSLNEDFYREALASKNRFVREYFSFDLDVRNAKVEYLNAELGRPAEKDVVNIYAEEEEHVFAEEQKLDNILNSGDILTREKGIDELTWEKIDSLVLFDYFNLEVVLAFIAKLQIVARWFKLDETTGRQMFRQLVDEVRGTFQGVQYNGN